MPDTTIDNRTLLRRTLVTAGVMVSAGVLVVGMMTLVASAVADRVVSPPGEQSDGGGGAVAAPTIRRAPGARPSTATDQIAK